MQAERDASPFSFWPILAVLVLLVTWAVGQLGLSDAPRCAACPGHPEPAGQCLCYHAPPTPGPRPR